MADGFTNIPSSPRTLADIPGRGERAPQRGELIAAPEDLRTEARETREPVRARGEITRTAERDDGARDVTVRTPRGDMEIRVLEQKRTPPPRQGQRVEVELTINRQGVETVTIRPAATQPPQPQTQTEAPAVQRNLPITPEALSKARLAEIERSTPQTITPPKNINGLPETGSTIRIEPLSAQQVASITQPLLETLTMQLTENLTAAPALSTLEIPETQNLLQTAAQPQVQVTPLQAFLTEVPQPQPGQVPQNVQTTFAPPVTELLSLPTQKTPLSQVEIAAPFARPSALEALQTEKAAAPPSYLNVKVESVLPPAVTLAQESIERPESLIQNERPGRITATVTGFTDRGLPALELQAPLFNVPQQFSLQVTEADNVTQGSRLVLTPQGQSPGIQTVVSGLTVQPAALLAPGAWPVMQETLQVLSQNAPALAQALGNVTANPANATPAQVTSAAMFFIAALRSGDIGSWLGDKALDVLRREGKGGLLSRLGAESSALSRLGSEPVSQDWRGMSIPMMWQNEMQKIGLYYKHDESGDEAKPDKGKHTRFLFDLDLTRMGKVQLDGLLRGTKLDLIVRTGQAFSGAMQQEMRQIYTGALEQAQMSGELSFTAKPDKWVTINIEDDKKRSVSA